MEHIDFYFDFGSPASYVAFKALPQITTAACVKINWKPILLGGIFQATGNRTPVSIPAKGKWMMGDLAHWATKYNIPTPRNSYFPINTLQLMRGATGHQMRGRNFEAYVDLIYRGIWEHDVDVGNLEALGKWLVEGGLDPQEIMQMISDQSVKDKLKADTEEAVARGLFGAPTIFINEEMYFGQDRLFMVAEALGQDITKIFPKYINPVRHT